MTSPTAILAPNPRWSALEQIGVPAANGYVFTFENLTRAPKATYENPAETILNNNPIRLDSKGEANIYWDVNDTFYTIEVYAANPTSPFIPGELIYSQDNYPYTSGSGGGNIILNSLANNLVRNSQFTIWGSPNYLLPTSATPQDIYTRLGTNDFICDDFIFERNNTNSTVSISRQQFTAGQTDVPASPVNYLHYECTNVGAAGETFKNISQTYQSAETFSDLEVSAAIYAQSSTMSTITVFATQFFGTGGSPSAPVITQIFSADLTTSWEQYQGTISIPSVTGKTFGTNGDDYLKLSIGLPLNAIAALDVDNFQFHGQNTLPDFPYNSVNDQLKRLDAVVNEGTFRTSDFVLSIDDSNRQGWLLCDDMTIGSSFSNAAHTGNQYLQLYLTIWDKVSNDLAPIYDSAGALTVRGSTAIDDWNNDKQLNLTRTLGRVFGAVGQPTYFEQFTATITSFTFTASTSTNQLTVSSTTSMPTGQAISFTTGGSLPSPLLVGTTYFAVNTGPTTIRIATTYANAIAAVTINITTTGSGTNTVFSSDTLSVGDAVSFYTGTPVRLTNTGGALPTPLVAATTYYAIYVDSVRFKLATSFANAITGISIPLTTAGTGINVATITYSQSLSNCQVIGEFYHGQTAAEVGTHAHTISYNTPSLAGGPSAVNTLNNPGAVYPTTSSGSSTPFNIVQPSIYTNCFLKL